MQISDLREELEESRREAAELQVREARLKARIYAQQMEEINIPAVNTVYVEVVRQNVPEVPNFQYILQDPDTVAAHPTKANLINAFDMHMVGRKRTSMSLDDLCARTAAEFANTMRVEPEFRDELEGIFVSRAMDTFQKRAVAGVKRRRID